MKITVLTQGTRRDVQPYVALGKGLIKRGYHVPICTGDSFRDFPESQAIFNGGVLKKDIDIDFIAQTLTIISSQLMIKTMINKNTSIEDAIKSMSIQMVSYIQNGISA